MDTVLDLGLIAWCAQDPSRIEDLPFSEELKRELRRRVQMFLQHDPALLALYDEQALALQCLQKQ